MGILDGKRILVTGVLTDASLAFGVARLAQQEGAELVLSGAGRGLSLTKRTARKLDDPVDVIEIDVTDQAHLDRAAAELTERWGRVDGILHAIGFAPAACLGGDIMRAGVGQPQPETAPEWAGAPDDSHLHRTTLTQPTPRPGQGRVGRDGTG